MTVAELVNGGPLAGARMYGDGENPVHEVRIVDHLEVFGSVAPHTAVVLIGAAASGGWAVEMAMRRAWEQAAACVIAPSAAVSGGSGAVLAERLGVTLIFVDEDPLVTAVQVASAAARPGAARTQLVARCATRLAEVGGSARRVLAVLNAELPGTAVAFLDPYGTRVAGRAGRPEPASRRPASPPGQDSRAGQGEPLATMEVLDQEGGPLGTLVARGSSRSPGWPWVVNAVLALAVAPLAAWAATERLAADRDLSRRTALAERLLSDPPPEPVQAPGDATPEAGGPGEEGWARAAALGWPVRGELTGFMVRPVRDAAVASQVITACLGPGPLMLRGDGWAGWSAAGPDEVAEWLRERLPVLPVPCSAGVGARAEGLAAVNGSLLGAEAAALVAGEGGVASADRMGPGELLAALPGTVLRAPSLVLLRPLTDLDRDGVLLETLAAVLDEGGAIRAAERLGVHRNTVTARLERIRAAGFDLDDPATRLALHVASHVLRVRG
ncbi:helix-turn-helix domain-containing protein [Nonomuraea sp. NPDC046570]|uniref:PucR family transcriptional regulator n=1 Tax=Nonomuraea sp. NPDC046570 TaxID=3155255 RepID=UPI0033EFBB96